MSAIAQTDTADDAVHLALAVGDPGADAPERLWDAGADDRAPEGSNTGPLPNGDPPSLMLWGDEA
jgi:hypothetical protein